MTPWIEKHAHIDYDHVINCVKHLSLNLSLASFHFVTCALCVERSNELRIIVFRMMITFLIIANLCFRIVLCENLCCVKLLTCNHMIAWKMLHLQLHVLQAENKIPSSVITLLMLVHLMLQFKAAIRTFNPREEKYMQPEPKFKLAVSARRL